MTISANPYTQGSPAYLAWEAGYRAALDDVTKLYMEGKSYGGGYKTEDAGAVSDASGRDEAEGQQG